MSTKVLFMTVTWSWTMESVLFWTFNDQNQALTLLYCRAQSSNIGAGEDWLEHPPSGPTTCMDGHRGRCIVGQVAGNSRKLGMLTPGGTDWFKGTWNKTSLAEQEPKPVQEVEWNQLDIVGLTSTHCSGTRFLDRGWTYKSCTKVQRRLPNLLGVYRWCPERVAIWKSQFYWEILTLTWAMIEKHARGVIGRKGSLVYLVQHHLK